MESMTTTTDPLSPERVEAALEWLNKTGEVRAADQAIRLWARDPLPSDAKAVETARIIHGHRDALAALARAHLDATKREPPAGLAEVIAGATCSAGVRVDQYAATLAPAIARAVEAFATSPESVSRVSQVIWEIESSYLRAAIRAALGVKEESE